MLDLIFFTCRRRRRQRALGQLASSRCRTSAKCVNQHQSCDSVRAFEFIMHDGSEQFNVPQVHAMTALRQMPGCSLSCNTKRVEWSSLRLALICLLAFFQKMSLRGVYFCLRNYAFVKSVKSESAQRKQRHWNLQQIT